MATERWDRDRFVYERDRLEDERYASRPHVRVRDRSDERHNRPRFHDDDLGRDRRSYDDDGARREPQRERPAHEYDRRVFMEKERDREYYRDVSPRRPGFLRRQSSLDTFDRRPLRPFPERQEYPPPARREDVYRAHHRDEYRDDYRDDYRAPAYTPIPLPQTRALPPPRRYPDRAFYDDMAGPDRYVDEDLRVYPERVREREVVRERKRRDHSRDSRTTRTRGHRSSSRSSTTTSYSSSSGGGTTVRSNEYPKKGKTKIPARLVSKRAIIDLGYPYIEEGNTVIVQKALGQENIDELLKLSEDYMKAEQEVAAARSSAGDIMEERQEERLAIPPPPASVVPPTVRAASPARAHPTAAPSVAAATSHHAPPPPASHRAPPPPASYHAPAHPPPPASYHAPPPPPPMSVHAPPAPPPPPAIIEIPAPPAAAPVEIVDRSRTVIRDVSPARTTTTSTSSWDSHSHHHHHRHGHGDALVRRSRSRSKSGRELRAEIRALERELSHRPKGELGERDIVRTERLPDGELVVYQESVERQSAGPKPPRIEKDKKGPPPMLLRAMLGTLT